MNDYDLGIAYKALKSLSVLALQLSLILRSLLSMTTRSLQFIALDNTISLSL